MIVDLCEECRAVCEGSLCEDCRDDAPPDGLRGPALARAALAAARARREQHEPQAAS
jgi:hypothetical protein